MEHPHTRFLNEHFEKALILEEPDPGLDDYLREQDIEPERVPKPECYDQEAMVERLREGQHDLIYKRSKFVVDEAVVEASDNLAGVLVQNDPVSNGRSVVEMVVGEMILLSRRLYTANESGGRHRWTKDSTRRYELRDKTLSIIGLGNIGKQLARLADSFGMDIYFYDKSDVAQEVGTTLGWTSCGSISEAFRKGDFVTVHVSAEDPQGQSNEGLLGYDHFRQLGADRPDNSPRAFINAARGFLYNPADLKRAVEKDHVRAAAVDVFPEEPGSEDEDWTNPYAELDNVFTTPHIGAATQEAQPRIASRMATSTRLLNEQGTVRDTVFGQGQTIGVNAEPPHWILAVVHSDVRGTKKAIDDTIYEAGASNLQSNHRDFPDLGIAYDVNAIDQPLSDEQLHNLVDEAVSLSDDPRAIRTLRQFKVNDG
ncbi:MAG: 3-phosphoglycerate dehydrogenase [Bacteroidetes bacterium QH_2_63_10]|nr:MAG: 3-phosphoglycerate dehydrogenase [Bacteroidetes bacterium QH_2_63_10]